MHTIALLLIVLLGTPIAAAAQEVNVVKSIRAVGKTVEIELESTKEFPVRDEVVVLRIGEKEFSKSRSPKGGSLKGLVFVLTADEFEKLTDGDQMTVGYGRQPAGEEGVLSGSAAGPRWDFGKLNKTLLGR